MNNNRLSSRGWSGSGALWLGLLLCFLLTVSSAHAAPTFPSETARPAHRAGEILFIEDNLPDAALLRAQTPADIEVVSLSAAQDGLAQMAQYLQGRQHITALHILSHGTHGRLTLGRLQLDQASLAQRTADLERLHAALDAQADILLYGCDVGQGEAGRAFVAALAEATGAHVAASDDTTGPARLGGNWQLEQHSAALRTASLSYPAYGHVLASVAGTLSAPNGNSVLGSVFSDGQAGTTDIPNIQYDLYFAEKSASNPTVPGNILNFLVTAHEPHTYTPIFIQSYSADSTTDAVEADFLVIKSHDGTPFYPQQFLWADPYPCNSSYVAQGMYDNTEVANYHFSLPSQHYDTITLPDSFKYINELRIHPSFGNDCVDFINKPVLYGEGINNVVIADAQQSADANLQLISISYALGPNSWMFPGVSPLIDANTLNYTSSVGNEVGSVDLRITQSNHFAITKINGVQLADNGSTPVTLNAGPNPLHLVVTSQDGSVQKTYTLTVTRAPSTNADLGGLSLSAGSLNPAFTSATTVYSASVANATTSITVTPTVADGTASVTVNGLAVASGNASGAIALNVGSNTITTTVTAQDGSTQKIYTTTVTRAPSSNADLAALSLSAGSLSPGFASATTGYSATVSNGTTSVTLTPVVADATASVKINGVSVASGNASSAINLNVGSNTLNVTVTAQDGTTLKTYTVTITRAPSSDATLASLTPSAGTLNPAFSGTTTNYTASVGSAVTSIRLRPTTTDAAATITVNGTPVASGAATGNLPLAVGSNVITTEVTAEDGSTRRTYTLTVTRLSNNASLSQLTLSAGTLSPAFAPGTTAYSASVANAITSLTVSPTVADSTATVTVNGSPVGSGNTSGAIALNVGTNALNIVVTAQDGTTVTHYTVTVTRAASDNANLANLSLSAGTLNPAFAPGTTGYSASVGNATTSLTLTPVVEDSTATVKINGVAINSGTASAALPLNVGSNTLTTVVTAENGATRTYQLTVTRAPSSNADLANLSLSAGTLAPVFATGTTQYSATVLNAITSMSVRATLADPTATLTIAGTPVASGTASPAQSLAVGSNTLLVVVTAQDGSTQKTYTLTVNRADVLGQCGPAAGVTTAFKPQNTTLCAAGSAGAVSVNGGTWAWTCTAPAGDASCAAPVQATAGNGGTVSVEVAPSHGWELDAAHSAGFIPLTNHPKSPPASAPAPAGYTFPHGLLDFRLINGTANSDATVVITYPQPLPQGTVYWKYGPTRPGGPAQWYAYPGARISGNTITLTLTDQGAGDSDLATPQSITDPGGPGVPINAGLSAIPTLSQWAMVILAALIALSGAALRLGRKP